MKNLIKLILLGFILFGLLFLNSCNHNLNDCDKEEKYTDITVQIMSKGGEKDHHGKFPDTYGKSFLVRSINDTTQFTEISLMPWQGPQSTNVDFGTNTILSDSLFYTKQVGDTLHCKCMSYKRFWTDKR